MRHASLIPAIIMVASAANTRAVDQTRESAAANREQLEHWIADLDAASFAVREHATRRLLEAGTPAIGVLAAVDESSSVEQITRAVSILAALSFDGTDATQVAACSALE